MRPPVSSARFGAGLAPLFVGPQAYAAVEELALPAQEVEIWPWLVLAVVVFASAAVFAQWLKTGEEKREVDSFEAWSKTEHEIAPRAHTGARLPGREASATLVRKPRPPEKPAPAFGRRS